MGVKKISQLTSKTITSNDTIPFYDPDSTSGTYRDTVASLSSVVQSNLSLTASDITDFDTEVSNNTDVAANTSARHNAVTVSGTPDYITLSGQDIVRGKIDLTADVTGALPIANGGTGQTTQQAALNAITAVSGATNEYVLTKDTGTGNATWKASSSGTTSPLTTKGDVWGYSSTDARIPVGANGTVLTADSAEVLGVKWASVAGTGDVTAAASLTDNAIVRGDGGSKGVQTSNVLIDDSNNISGVVNLTQTGYTDLTEISAPTNPSANVGRLYSKDSSGTTKLYFKDSSGTETDLLAGGSGGATTALDNLASVAINTSLVSDTDSTDDLGSSTKQWKDLYIDRILNATTGNLTIENDVSDGDIIFKVNDGGVDKEMARIDASTYTFNIGGITTTTSASANVLDVLRGTDVNSQAIYADCPATSTSLSTTFAGFYLANSSATNNNWVRFNFGNGNSNSVGAIGIQITDHTNRYGKFFISTQGSGNAVSSPNFWIDEIGNVGINVSSPDANSQCEIETTKTQCLLLDQNTSGNTYALRTECSGTYAFNFAGSEVVSSAGGSTQDKIVKVIAGGFDYELKLWT